MQWETIIYEKIGHIVKIILNRPETHNAQNIQLIKELDEAMQEAERDPDIRVIILSGKGPSFSSGHDLKGLAEKSQEGEKLYPSLEDQMRFEQEFFVDKCLAIRNLTKPTIAQVHGHCIAAGFMLASMCDIIIASDDAQFSNPVLRMTPSAAELLVEPWEMGARKAKEFLFTGDPIDAQEAWRIGMINRVVPRHQLDEEVLKLAQRIALMPPVAISLTKASINRTLDLMGQSNAFSYHFLIHQISHRTDESSRFFSDQGKAREKGLKAFLEKRDGIFKEP
jgi:enoyl-CoA hydratase